MEITIGEEQVKKIVTDLFENYPEAGGGMALKCMKWDYKRFNYVFFDEEEEKDHVVTKEDALRGLKLFIEGAFKKEHSMSINFDDADAFTSDAVLQYAIFGKLVYG
jgi:hypothetical protein